MSDGQQNIGQKPRAKDVPMTREQFQEEKSGNFVKLDADKEYIVGIHSANYVRRDFGEGLKPTLVLTFDHFDGKDLDEAVEFSSSSKFLAEQIEDYRKNQNCNLLTWFFKIKKTGSGMQTKYTLVPSSPRPKA